MPWSVANLNLDIVCRTVFSIVFFIFTYQAGVSIQLSDKLFFSSLIKVAVLLVTRLVCMMISL